MVAARGVGRGDPRDAPHVSDYGSNASDITPTSEKFPSNLEFEPWDMDAFPTPFSRAPLLQPCNDPAWPTPSMESLPNMLAFDCANLGAESISLRNLDTGEVLCLEAMARLCSSACSDLGDGGQVQYGGALLGSRSQTTCEVSDDSEIATLSLAPASLPASFPGTTIVVEPKLLASKRRPWKSWWREKKQNDEALWSAAEAGNSAELKKILAREKEGGVTTQINSRIDGRTALHIAADAGFPNCVRVLLEAGGSVIARTDEGLTPLHLASRRGHLEVARLLLKHGADVYSQSEDGSIPLHLAASNGHIEVVAMFLQRNDDRQVTMRNSLGQRPVDIALNISTAFLFPHSPRGDQKLVANDNGVEDRYAGRTPFYEGTVLLHNARADAVRKLLHRTREAPRHVQQQSADIGGQEPQKAASPIGCLNSGSHPDDSAQPPLARRATSVNLRSRDGISPSSISSRSPTHSAVPRRNFHSARTSFARVRTDSPVSLAPVGPSSFDLVRRLGKGAFGEVFHVVHKKTYKPYAMKVLLKSKALHGNVARYTLTERNLLSYLRHPYIVPLHYAFQTPEHLVLVLHYCQGGNLQRLMQHERRLRVETACLYSAEILLALMHLHERQIIYRDLKPENVVLDDNYHAMLTDFGLSKEGVEGLRGTQSFCGSFAFLAPEILSRSGHGPAVDLYGLGVLLFAMLTGMPPFYHPDRDTLVTNIRTAQLRIPLYVPRAAASLILTLMEREPARRLGARCTSDVQQHAFFAGTDWDKLMKREVPGPTLERHRLTSGPQPADLPVGNKDRGKPPHAGTADVAPPPSPFLRSKGSGWRRRRSRSSTHSDEDDGKVPGWDFASYEGA